MKLIFIALIVASMVIQAYCGLVPMKSSKGKRDFVPLQPVAVLTVATCPQSGNLGTITQYSAQSCTPDESTDNVFVLFSCSANTLTLFNAYDGSGNAYSGSYIISGYTFGTGSVSTSYPSGSPAVNVGFYSASLTCQKDYCGNQYVSGCSTPLASSDSNNDPIFVLTSGGCTTVDFCRGGGSSPTCCSGVTTSNCPFHGTRCSGGAFSCSCSCPAQSEYPYSTFFNQLNYCFPDTDGSGICTFNAQCNGGACSTTADCSFPQVCSGGYCFFPPCSTDSDCPVDTFCSPNGCGSVCYPAGIGCTSSKREIPAYNSSSVIHHKSDGTYFCSQCSTTQCRMDCKATDTNCCV